MRTIERTTQFRRDYKREAKGRHRVTLAADVTMVIVLLQQDQTLDVGYRDHPLSGEWRDHRDCHIRPDLVLIYRLPDELTLQLVPLGSHCELDV